MSRLNDILKKNEGRLPDDILMPYVQGKLSPEEQHEIELFLAEDGPESDAVEGLKDYSERELSETVRKVNSRLAQSLNKPKRRTQSIKKTPWGITGILLILLLCLAAYMVIYFLTKK